MAPRGESQPLLLPVEDIFPSYIIDKSEKNKTKQVEEVEEVVVKTDGGWGWLVVIAGFFCCFLVDGIEYTFGVFLNPLLAEMGGGVGGVAAVGSLQVGASAFSGPISAWVVNKFGARRACMIGTLWAFGGLLAASFVSNLTFLILSYSLVTGLGFGLMYISAIASVAEWFDSKRALAIGICLCGSGAGTFALAPIVEILLEQLGWRWTFRALAGICLACTVCGAVMAPGPGKVEVMEEERECGEGERKGRRGCSVTEKILGVKLANHPNLTTFLLMSVADGLATMALYIPYTHLMPVVSQAGVPPAKAAFLISTVGMGSVVGRVTAGWMSDKTWGSPHVITLISIILTIATPVLITMASMYWMLVVLTLLFGFLTGSWVSATSPLIVTILGPDQLTSAFGLLTALRGSAALSSPPIAGLVVDCLASKRVALYISGCLMTASATMYSVALWWRKRREKRMAYESV